MVPDQTEQRFAELDRGHRSRLPRKPGRWRRRILRSGVAGATLLGGAVAVAGLTGSVAGAATAAFTVADGFASYAPASVLPATTTVTPVTFEVSTLATGGTADAATLTITAQPASGTATADTTTGVITYTPMSSTAGTQVVGFSVCTAPSTSCESATVTFGPALAVNSAYKVPILGGYGPRTFYYGAQAPSSTLPGSTFTMSVAQAAQVVPKHLSLSSFTVTIAYVNDMVAILPVPANATYVTGSARSVGGTAATAGKVKVTYCTAFGTYTAAKATKTTAPCTATEPPGATTTFPTATTTPYLEEQLTRTVHIAGGTPLTLPTLVATFTASGPNGSMVQPVVTETDLGTNVTGGLLKTGHLEVSILSYPTTPSFTKTTTKKAPAYYAYPLATTSIATNGYWEVASDGGIFSFGTAQFYGSMGGKPLNKPVVGMASTPDRLGYWEVASDGGIFAFGDAGFYGSMGSTRLNAPVVGMAAAPTGKGYWEAAATGGVFAFGTAGFYGSMAGIRLDAPVVGIAAAPTGKGYWEVSSDGAIFAFGSAVSYGSMATTVLDQPVVAMAATSTGMGYWEMAATGGVFAFGTAGFYGSMGGTVLNKPVVGAASTSTGKGYWEVASDGGIFSFGAAHFYGSMGGKVLNAPLPK